jgi:hypothetical protein
VICLLHANTCIRGAGLRPCISSQRCRRPRYFQPTCLGGMFRASMSAC